MLLIPAGLSSVKNPRGRGSDISEQELLSHYVKLLSRDTERLVLGSPGWGRLRARGRGKEKRIGLLRSRGREEERLGLQGLCYHQI